MDELAKLYWNPLGYVMFAFPWSTAKEIQQVRLDKRYHNRFPNCEFGPDVWACEFLDELGAEILDRGFNGMDPIYEPIRFASASGHGIGKSVMTSWLIKFIADTRPFSKGTVTAAKQDQLKTKTWAELGKWHRLSITNHLFNFSSGRGSMYLRHKLYPEEWFCSAQTSKEENSESFAGQHAANSTSYYIFDEASGIPDKIFEVREGGLTDGEAMAFDFGNPTQNSGRFFEHCIGNQAHRYNVRMIDSRDVSITNKKLFKQWEEDYGVDSDFFKVRVKGEFPSRGSLEFIGREAVKTAMLREPAPQTLTDALVIGVDVARFGDDDSVIYPRIGMDARSYYNNHRRFQKLDTVAVSNEVIKVIREFRDMGVEYGAIFVDGGGIGGAVIDYLRALGYQNIFEVQFGSKASDADTYRYTMDQMWGGMRDAISGRLVLPVGQVGQDLMNQLTQRQYGFNLKEQIQLESKKDMKARGLQSPDIADALALTFYMPVEPRNLGSQNTEAQFAKSDFDPNELALDET